MLSQQKVRGICKKAGLAVYKYSGYSSHGNGFEIRQNTYDNTVTVEYRGVDTVETWTKFMNAILEQGPDTVGPVWFKISQYGNVKAFFNEKEEPFASESEILLEWDSVTFAQAFQPFVYKRNAEIEAEHQRKAAEQDAREVLHQKRLARARELNPLPQGLHDFWTFRPQWLEGDEEHGGVCFVVLHGDDHPNHYILCNVERADEYFNGYGKPPVSCLRVDTYHTSSDSKRHMAELLGPNASEYSRNHKDRYNGSSSAVIGRTLYEAMMEWLEGRETHIEEA